MSDWDDLEKDAKAAQYPGPKCGVFTMLRTLDETARASVERVLANVRLTSSGIHKALSARLPAEDVASTQSLTRHRRGACNCPKGDSE